MPGSHSRIRRLTADQQGTAATGGPKSAAAASRPRIAAGGRRTAAGQGQHTACSATGSRSIRNLPHDYPLEPGSARPRARLIALRPPNDRGIGSSAGHRQARQRQSSRTDQFHRRRAPRRSGGRRDCAGNIRLRSRRRPKRRQKSIGQKMRSLFVGARRNPHRGRCRPARARLFRHRQSSRPCSAELHRAATTGGRRGARPLRQACA